MLNPTLEPTIFTWILVCFGMLFIFLPMLYIQILTAVNPHSQKTKDIIIGKNEDFRDKTHLRMSLGLAWSDLLIWLPILLIGSIGVLLGTVWGYLLWSASGILSVYINIHLWVAEKEYVYPSAGWLKYYTYFWGFFIYWGLLTAVYSIVRLVNL